MVDEKEGIVFAVLGIVGGVIPMVQKYRDSDGSYNKKQMAADFILLFVAGAPAAYFVGLEVSSQGFERVSPVMAWIAGVMANEIMKVLVTKSSGMITLLSGGKL